MYAVSPSPNDQFALALQACLPLIARARSRTGFGMLSAIHSFLNLAESHRVEPPPCVGPDGQQAIGLALGYFGNPEVDMVCGYSAFSAKLSASRDWVDRLSQCLSLWHDLSEA